MHSEICAVPAGRLETVRELLGVLPSLRLEIGPRPSSRKVDKLSCVRFASARYSVPNRFIGATVLITVTDTRLQISSRSQATSSPNMLCSHPVRPASPVSMTARPAPTNRGAHRGRKPCRKKQFLALGEIAAAFLTAAAAAGVANLARELGEILTLQVAHGDGPLLTALGRAVDSDAGARMTSVPSWSPPAAHPTPDQPDRRWY